MRSRTVGRTSSCVLVSLVLTLGAMGVASAGVEVNGAVVPTRALDQLQIAFGWRIPDGSYWYDPVCGAWGFPGGPTQGFIAPLLQLGAPLRADASGGGSGRLTGVFINGREIHPHEAYALSQLVPVSPGRFWLDAYGNAGYEGGPALVNLYQLARSQRGSGAGYHHAGPGGYSGSDGDTFYYFDPESGSSVMNNGY